MVHDVHGMFKKNDLRIFNGAVFSYCVYAAYEGETGLQFEPDNSLRFAVCSLAIQCVPKITGNRRRP